MRMRRALPFAVLIPLAVGLVFLLRHRKRQFVAAQIELLQSNDTEQASQARKTLQRLGRSAVRPVCALLEHKDADVRAPAALTLANIGEPAACGLLMEAAKRGDFPAADALEFMKHPRAKEARAWAHCRLADMVFEEFQLRLPVSGRLPTSPRVVWRDPMPWKPVVRETLYPIADEYEEVDRPYWGDVQSEIKYADVYYTRAIQRCAIPDALIGQARIRALCGSYSEAAELSARALQQAPTDAAVRNIAAETERLATLRRAMQALLPDAYRIERTLTHPSWRQGDATYYVATATFAPARPSFLGVAAKLIPFREQHGELHPLPGVSPPTEEELLRSGLVSATYTDLCVMEPGRAASVVVVRAATELYYPGTADAYQGTTTSPPCSPTWSQARGRASAKAADLWIGPLCSSLRGPTRRWTTPMASRRSIDGSSPSSGHPPMSGRKIWPTRRRACHGA